jgi:hypothetical protein
MRESYGLSTVWAIHRVPAKIDELMKKVIKVSPEELKRRLAESKTIKSTKEDKPKKGETASNRS